MQLPPLPPKRRYRSLAVGDEVPLDEVVCYQKGCSSSQFLCKPSPRNNSVDFSSIVDQAEIDAAFDIFRPPRFADATTSTTDKLKLHSTAFQTDYLKTTDSSAQTLKATQATIGCGPSSPTVVSNNCKALNLLKRLLTSRPVAVKALAVLYYKKKLNCFSSSSIFTKNLIAYVHTKNISLSCCNAF